MDLAFDQQRVDDGAEIVDRRILHDLDHAGRRIDLDLGDVTPVGECRRNGVGDVPHVERFRRALR